MAGPYALYLGKLAPNKGTAHLVDIAERAELDWPLVIAGDGPERDAIAADARAIRSRHPAGRLGRSGERPRPGWPTPSMLIFPSRGPESLSRVLIEASALGVPIAAMNTGGTPDIVEHERDGPALDTPEGSPRTCGGCAATTELRRGSARRAIGARRRARSTPPATIARGSSSSIAS